MIDNNTGEWFTNFWWERAKDGPWWSLNNCNWTNMYTYDVPAVPAGAARDIAAVRINCWINGTYGAGIDAVLGLPCNWGGTTYPNLWISGYPGEHPNEQWEDYGSWHDVAMGPGGWDEGCAWLVHGMYQRDGMSGGPFTIGGCPWYGMSECVVGSVANQGHNHRFHPNEIPMLQTWRGY